MHVSESTIRRNLNASGLMEKKLARDPKLTREQGVNKLAFAHAHGTVEDSILHR